MWGSHVRKLTARGETFSAEYRRLPLACIAGPIYVVSMLWQAWTVRPGIHYLVPIAAGLPLRFAFSLLLIALLNYITDFRYAPPAPSPPPACVVPSSSLPSRCSRNGCTRWWGINWASNFLGMVAVLLTTCLFSFIKYGISLSFPSCAPDAYG